MSILKEYFTFSRNQRIAIITIVLLIFLINGINFCLPYFVNNTQTTTPVDLQAMMNSIQLDSNQNNYANSFSKNYQPHTLTPFTFNPNTLDSQGFIKLGLREKLVHTILNYRNKGGHYYSKEGFKKMYGLHEDEYTQLENYISIPETNTFKKHEKEKLHIDIATADTALLNKLNGIGNKLAENIVQYRDRLGGYYTVEQLKEVWGISSETFEKIKLDCYCSANKCKKINLNEATLQEISLHPYLKGEIAKAIVDYRKAKNYHLDNIQQLKEIPLINAEIFRKIAPYLSTQ